MFPEGDEVIVKVVLMLRREDRGERPRRYAGGRLRTKIALQRKALSIRLPKFDVRGCGDQPACLGFARDLRRLKTLMMLFLRRRDARVRGNHSREKRGQAIWRSGRYEEGASKAPKLRVRGGRVESL